jgi:ATP-dependent DNA ligase
MQLWKRHFLYIPEGQPPTNENDLGILRGDRYPQPRRCAYYDLEGRLVYAGHVGTGINTAELERLWRRLQPHAISKMPLDVPPPRTSRFGSPLVLSRVH